MCANPQVILADTAAHHCQRRCWITPQSYKHTKQLPSKANWARDRSTTCVQTRGYVLARSCTHTARHVALHATRMWLPSREHKLLDTGCTVHRYTFPSHTLWHPPSQSQGGPGTTVPAVVYSGTPPQAQQYPGASQPGTSPRGHCGSLRARLPGCPTQPSPAARKWAITALHGHCGSLRAAAMSQ
jgi:hypothetical protein